MRTLALAIASLLAAACGDREPDTRICTAIGCFDGLGIAIPGRGAEAPPALPEGHYDLQLTYDGNLAVCQNDLPRTDVTFRCTDPSLNSAVFDLGGPAQNPVRVLAQIEGRAPESLEIVLLLDDVVIASSNVTPRYDELFPNGPECGGPCRQGAVEVEIDRRTLSE